MLPLAALAADWCGWTLSSAKLVKELVCLWSGRGRVTLLDPRDRPPRLNSLAKKPRFLSGAGMIVPTVAALGRTPGAALRDGLVAEWPSA